jgi:pimeloyl-ACP methyl ester carboxylesterase
MAGPDFQSGTALRGHDLGLMPSHSSADLRGEVDGANAARDVLTSDNLDPADGERVGTGVAMEVLGLADDRHPDDIRKADVIADKERTKTMNNPNVILVHGAWADGSNWAKVIPLLTAKGVMVTAVQLPLTSFEADVATVGRAITLAEGEVVLVGHSYAGAVIGQAGNDPKVASLVYIAAFAPDAGESVGSLLAQFQAAPLNAEVTPDAQGFLKLTLKGICDLFAQDLDRTEQAAVYATQGPINRAALGGVLTQAAWRSRPTFYLICDEDLAVPRVEQERMATRMKATIAHVGSSHVPMLSHPDSVADLILRAGA